MGWLPKLLQKGLAKGRWRSQYNTVLRQRRAFRQAGVGSERGSVWRYIQFRVGDNSPELRRRGLFFPCRAQPFWGVLNVRKSVRMTLSSVRRKAAVCRNGGGGSVRENMKEIRCATLGETWLAALRKVYRSGRSVSEEMREVLHLWVAFEQGDFQADPLLVRFASSRQVEEMPRSSFPASRISSATAIAIACGGRRAPRTSAT